METHATRIKNPLVWAVVGILWLLVLLPYRWQLTLGERLGQFIGWCSPHMRRVVATNLRLCFPELSEEERDNLARKNFRASGVTLLESGLAWWASDDRLRSLTHVHGKENLDEAFRAGKGVIMCSAHFLCLEISGRLATHLFPFAAIYRPHKKTSLNKLLYRFREKLYDKIIAREALRDMLRYLKGNGAIWYTPDIDAGEKNSIFVPFFGVSAASITATSRLAQLSGAKVVPTFFYRRDDKTGYDIVFLPALDNFPSNDVAHDTLRINQAIETAIRKKPEQYLWQYRRFKTRPAGEERFY